MAQPPRETESFVDKVLNSRTKKVAFCLVLGYIGLKFYQTCVTSDPEDTAAKPSSSSSSSKPHVQNEADHEPDESSLQQQLAPIKEQPNPSLNAPRRYIPPLASKGIPVSEPVLVILSAGHAALNGTYRWFLHDSKWCLFSETSKNHFCLKSGVSTSDIGLDRTHHVQAQRCWIISDLSGSVVYYAAPQTDDDYIPNNTADWIPVRGAQPVPQIFVNLVDQTKRPDDKVVFGNAVPSDDKIHVVFGELAQDGMGRISAESMHSGTTLLGISEDLAGEDKSKMFTEDEFTAVIKEWYARGSGAEPVSFEVQVEERNEEGDSVMVHQAVDDDDEESEISDIE